MITKPKAKKFRIRRSASLTVVPSGDATAQSSYAPLILAQPTIRAAASSANANTGNANTGNAGPANASVISAIRATIAATDNESVGQPIPLHGPAPLSPPRRSAPTDAPTDAPPAARTARRAAPSPAPEATAPDDLSLLQPQDDGFGPQSYIPAGRNPVVQAVIAPGEIAVGGSDETDLDQIRRESLTGRQLRMARRLAQKHGLPATSDFDAVRLLRRQGIDPFQRTTMLDLVLDDQLRAEEPRPPVQLPQTVKPVALPSTEVRPAPVSAPVSRLQEIMDIQRDLARRRQRKSLLLLTRLLFFVLIPTLLAGIYYYTIATPFYATKSGFVIQQAQAPGAGAMGGLLSGTAFATSTDSITVQDYLTSRDAMMRLNADLGFKAHFSQPWIDPIQRLETGATNEDAYKLYKRNVKIGFDPSEGIIRMEVIAADPQVSKAFSLALIQYAEEQVDHLTSRVREDQMKGAQESLDDAELQVGDAQIKVVGLQQQFKLLSSEAEVSMVAAQITTLETQLSQERLRLEELLANQNPSAARVDPVRNRIANLEAEIATTREKMSLGDANGLGLAQMQSDLLAAQADVATRQLMLSTAMQSVETARVEANRQTRYLSIAVNPVAPDEATYPRAFENTFVAFLIFAGVYLMLSMTVAILREQVSS